MDGPRLVQTDRGQTVHAFGRYLYSSRDPAGRPDRIASSAERESRCLYIVPSPLLGYGLEKLLQRIPENSHIIAIEASQELMGLCAPELPESLSGHPNLSWVRISDPSALHTLLYRLGPWRFRRVRRVDLSGGASTNGDLYDSLINFLATDLATYWRNRHALGRLGREWVRHIYANLAAIASDDVPMRSRMTPGGNGIPVVIGAGPSLEEALPFLKANRKHLWLLATDTAASALTESGITPDAVAVLETQSWNMLDFHGLGGSEIPIVADLTAYPPSFNATGGDIHLFSSDFAELEFLKSLDLAGLREHRLPPLGSVGLTAVEIALKRTEGPVFLTGLDFSYRPGKSHGRGTSVHRWQLINRSRLSPFPGLDASMRRPRLHGPAAGGGRISTDSVLEGYAALFKDRYAGSERLMVLPPGGLDLGLPLIDTESAAGLAREWTSDNNPEGAEMTNPAQREATAQSAGLFLERELGRLEAVIASWDEYAGGASDAWDVVDALQGMDQVFVDFPDEPPLPRPDDAFLVRAVSRCRKLHRYICRQLEYSGGRGSFNKLILS